MLDDQDRETSCESAFSTAPTNYFRHFFGQPSRVDDDGVEIGATFGVVASVLSMLEGGVTHLGVATDHVIESFRNDLWPGYKTGEGIDRSSAAQFRLLEEALGSARGRGLADGRGRGRRRAGLGRRGRRRRRRGSSGWSSARPDKDLAQCVAGRGSSSSTAART